MKWGKQIWYCPSCGRRHHDEHITTNTRTQAFGCSKDCGKAWEMKEARCIVGKDEDGKDEEETYILDGHIAVPEPDLRKWAIWMESADNVVARTQLGPSLVSTVFLGFNHRHFGAEFGSAREGAPTAGSPLLFETMVFTNGKPEDFQQRSSTWLEAETQHAMAVNEIARRQQKIAPAKKSATKKIREK